MSGGTTAPRREPLPSEDYYTIDYEPTALLDEWRALQREYAELRAHQQRRTNDEGGSSADTWPSASPSRSASSSSSLSSSSSATEGEDRRHRCRSQSASAAYAQVSDPYDRSREVARQEQFMSENRRLGRPFVPAANRNDGPTRLLLGDCVRDLYKCVLRDWSRAEPMVVSTAEDLIVVYFSLHRLKKKQAATVLAYMNSFEKRNETVREFRLRKVREGWDLLTDDGHLMYTFCPPWVRKGKNFLPDTVHPATAHGS